MGLRVRPWHMLAPPLSSFKRRSSLVVSEFFEYRPVGCNPTAPRFHRGSGEPVRCERTGDYFPSSRIQQQGDGKTVGDLVYVPRDGPVDGVEFWR